MTSEPVRPSDPSEVVPEFVRVRELQRLTGIKRGICYRKIADGTFRSILLREAGNVQGCRLVYFPGVRAYLHKLMSEQNGGKEVTP